MNLAKRKKTQPPGVNSHHKHGWTWIEAEIEGEIKYNNPFTKQQKSQQSTVAMNSDSKEDRNQGLKQVFTGDSS